MDAPSFQRQLDAEPHAISLDVRSEAEYLEGHLSGAIHVDVLQADFAERVQELNLIGPLYVYCRSGRRRLYVARILRARGHVPIHDLSNGNLGWEAYGLPITTDS